MGSGFKTFSSATKLLASDVNNYLMEQAVMYFASTTARDSAITAPEDGMVVYVGSNDSSEGLYTYNGTAWRKGPGWNAPWGVVGHVTRSADDPTTSGTMAEMNTAYRISVATCANRRLRFTVAAAMTNASGGGVIEVYNNTTSVTVARALQFNSLTAGDVTAAGVVIATSASGTTTYTLRFARVTGGTLTVVGGTIPTQFTIEDIGPSGAPA